VMMGRGDHIVLGEISLTPSARAAIVHARDHVLRLNQHYIGTEHLLLGLISEESCIAIGVLESLGIKLAQVHELTLQMTNQTELEEP